MNTHYIILIDRLSAFVCIRITVLLDSTVSHRASNKKGIRKKALTVTACNRNNTVILCFVVLCVY